ncbi:hypothetical protein SLA2020_384750 [Shorea laevis]
MAFRASTTCDDQNRPDDRITNGRNGSIDFKSLCPPFSPPRRKTAAKASSLKVETQANFFFENGKFENTAAINYFEGKS